MSAVADHEDVIDICPQCGSAFERLREKPHRYCSRQCAIDAGVVSVLPPTGAHRRRPFIVHNDKGLAALRYWIREAETFNRVDATGSDSTGKPILKIAMVSHQNVSPVDLIVCADALLRERASTVVLEELEKRERNSYRRRPAPAVDPDGEQP